MQMTIGNGDDKTDEEGDADGDDECDGFDDGDDGGVDGAGWSDGGDNNDDQIKIVALWLNCDVKVPNKRISIVLHDNYDLSW